MKTVFDAEFKKYGRVVTGLDTESLLAEMEKTVLPEDVVYVPGVAELEATTFAAQMKKGFYGGLDVQVGFCNGHNEMLNALEYHRNSEVNVAATDLILMLGAEQDIEDDFSYDTAKVEAFLVPKGTVIEVYATTLHYAPCGVDGAGFRCTVVLPKDTNLDLVETPDDIAEDKLLFARNKWLIAHEDAKIEGAFNGLKGKNLSVADFE